MCDLIRECFETLSERVPARVLLGIMAFLGFMVTQMVRANLYIAIVGMVGHGSEYLNNMNVTYPHSNSTDVPPPVSLDTVSDSKLEGFQWDEETQGILLGAFYWCYWVTELPGGVMAQRWGGRKVLGYGVAIAGVLNALVPLASKYHVALLAAVRAIQGLALGVTWPAMHTLAGRWIPAVERSKFMAAYHGAAIGSAITYPVCGLLMEAFGWESTFYMIAAVNLLWALGCYFLIYDNPEKHPRITTHEKKYLRRQLSGTGKTAGRKAKRTPWRNICTSSACWAVLAASLGIMWCTITLSMQLPTYLKNELNFDLQMNGILSGVPELSKFGFGLCFSALMDYLLQQNIMSLTAIRKISVATCEYIPAILLLIFGFIDASKNTTTAVVLLALASAFGGASSSGNLANIVDISPNFAGIILGLIKTMAVIPGILSPLVAGFLTAEDKTAAGWYTVFSTAAIIHLFCCTLFLIFGSAEVQPWNDIPDPRGVELEELRKKANLNDDKEVNGHDDTSV